VDLNVSPPALDAAGSEVGSTADLASLGGIALSGLNIPPPALGTGIGSAAARFASDLASQCSELASSAAGQGHDISQAARMYTAADQRAATGFDQIHLPSLAI